MRSHLRYVTELPIDISLSCGDQANRERLINISCGGLSFISCTKIDLDTAINVRIPLGNRTFEAEGYVVWCHQTGSVYEVGVRFNNPQTQYKTRMVDQLCHIERYRWQMKEQEGRSLTSEEAAQEWVSRFASIFSRINP